MTILSGSFVEYGPRECDGGGVERAVDSEAAYEEAAKDDCEDVYAVGAFLGDFGLSYGRKEYIVS